MKIEIRPEIGILMFIYAAMKKWQQSVAWFPKLRSEMHRRRRMQVFEKRQCIYVVTVNCNVSVYYRVT